MNTIHKGIYWFDGIYYPPMKALCGAQRGFRNYHWENVDCEECLKKMPRMLENEDKERA